jgi:hypothetical protein
LTSKLCKNVPQSCHTPYILGFFLRNYTPYIKERREYYGLCDIGASSSAIPLELYREIMHEIAPCELEEIDVVIQLVNR